MQTEAEIVREIRRVEAARTRTTSNALYRDYGKHLARLSEIFGTETVPFRERYPWLKEVRYGK